MGVVADKQGGERDAAVPCGTLPNTVRPAKCIWEVTLTAVIRSSSSRSALAMAPPTLILAFSAAASRATTITSGRIQVQKPASQHTQRQPSVLVNDRTSISPVPGVASFRLWLHERFKLNYVAVQSNAVKLGVGLGWMEGRAEPAAGVGLLSISSAASYQFGGDKSGK